MRIVTGYAGEKHITSNDDQGRNQGIFGTKNYILSVGNKFGYTLISANELQISDGEGVIQGVHFRVEPGTTDSVSIDNGTTGKKRIDLICAKYVKDALTGIESMSWENIKGTESSSTPSAPSYTAGDILAGDPLAEFPVYKVTLDGLSVDSVELVAQVLPTIDGLSNGLIVAAAATGSFSVGTAADSYTLSTVQEPLGYKFVSWIAAVSSGWVCPLYFENPTVKNTKVWKMNTSFVSGGLGGSFTAYALFEPDLSVLS